MAKIATKNFSKELKIFEYSMVGLDSINNFLIYAEKILETSPFFQKEYRVNYSHNKNITMHSLKEFKKYIDPVNIIEDIHNITCPIEFAFKKVEICYNIENSTATLTVKKDSTILSESSFERIEKELMLI